MGEGRAEASARFSAARMSTAAAPLLDYRSEGMSAHCVTLAWDTKAVYAVAARITLRLFRSIWLHFIDPSGKEMHPLLDVEQIAVKI